LNEGASLAEGLNAGCHMTVQYKIFEEYIAASVDGYYNWSVD
jgi:hypothetical protein